MIPLAIGTWNVRTFMDSAWSDRQQHRTAPVGRELEGYGIHIAALSETRFAEVLEIKEDGAGNTASSGADAKVMRGVKQELTLPLKRNLSVSFQDSKGTNDRLKTLRLPMSGNEHTTIVSDYMHPR